MQQKSSSAHTQASIAGSPQLGVSCGLQHCAGPPVSVSVSVSGPVLSVPSVLVPVPDVPSVVPVVPVVSVPPVPVLEPVLSVPLVLLVLPVLPVLDVLLVDPLELTGSPVLEVSPAVVGIVVGSVVVGWVVTGSVETCVVLLPELELCASVVAMPSSVQPGAAQSSAIETTRGEDPRPMARATS